MRDREFTYAGWIVDPTRDMFHRVARDVHGAPASEILPFDGPEAQEMLNELWRDPDLGRVFNGEPPF